ncbi:AT-rich interactive domain-containing protein 5B [Bienertia sinuspersici]
MARQLSKTLTQFSSSSSSSSFLKLLPKSLSSQFLSHPRNYFSTKGRLIEVELDSSSDNGGEIEVLGLKKLEDVIHSIIVRRLAPDWLPLRPGSSYWVPPKRNADNIVELVEKLTNPLTEEESLSLTSDRGFPSSSFFVKASGSGPVTPVEVEVHVLTNSGKPTVSEDEE